ncbi:hypothetical protein BDA96_04G201300 [Sorghum bicolor]|uniref:Uncharacterized protein n=1 Tax=Sorghum bicolor TaxID=4558 RepID=A0A921UIL9_SORBI|nr:hypothetical protein BDA96_04G201300 [Sorghum bicolor]
MASMMMGGDLVEAYVLKNAYKEKLRRMEAAEETKKGKLGPAAEKKASGGGSSSGGGGGGGGLFGLLKKKVHPKAAAASPMETS